MPFAAFADRWLPAVQMASMLLPSSTCCSLVTLPLLWLSPASATPLRTSHPFSLATRQARFHPSLVGQSWHILLKCLVHTGDRLVCLKRGDEMLHCGPCAVGYRTTSNISDSQTLHIDGEAHGLSHKWNGLTFWEVHLFSFMLKARWLWWLITLLSECDGYEATASKQLT